MLQKTTFISRLLYFIVLIRQNIEIINALRAAVYVHGLAGDIGCRIVGEHSLIAGDLIKYLPEAIKRITLV
jgi:NAD(P)H-hydrate epimerase